MSPIDAIAQSQAPANALYLVVAIIGLLAVGCRQQMADQPRQNPLSASAFFANGASARPLVEGTVPRGAVDQDSLNVSPAADSFPIPVTPQLLARGRERFGIFCSECHGLLGDGAGMIVRRGFPQPPSYHTERLRAAPLGHFYDVVTHGYGYMPSYAAQVPPRDRWAIIAYIRALQFSQYARAGDLPADVAGRLSAGGAR